MSLPPDFVNELRKRFAGDIRLDDASRVLYSTDASIYQIEPLGVALPKTQDDLQAAVELAAKYKIPILPRGAGSSLAGQAIGEALILDCSRGLDSILAIDPESRTATVEPGVVLADLNRAVAKHGLMFGPDPASAERATMGGVIGNNATGAHSILYGMTADHLVSVDVILADGGLATFDNSIFDARSSNPDSRISSIVSAALEIREKYSTAIHRHFPKSWRNSAGYRLNYLLPWSPSAPPQWIGDSYPADLKPETWNLAHLLAGSEGTLAVIRRAMLNLVPKPKHTILGILAYDSIAAACDDVPRLLEFHPSAVELIPQMIMHLARGVPAYARQMGWLSGDPSAILVVEFSGDQPKILRQSVERIANSLAIAESPEDQARIWNVRKVGLGILDSRPQAARPVAFIEDCAIPVERLGEFVREVERILSAHHTEGGIYAHASAGCLHIRPILNLKSGEGVRSLRSIAEQTLALTLRLGGSMSSEHGDGIVRGEWLKQTYGDDVVEAMRLLKRAADPDSILNPGKMFDAPPMDSHLRYGESYFAQAWTPALDFSRNGGLPTAIQQCNGQGVCRKTTGVMCPSYQATREESNSTRGRANLLRALITLSPSLRGANGMGDEAISSAMRGLLRREERPPRNDNGGDGLLNATYHALDLCLACKGCKAECPSGVDMAKLKFEFMHEYYKSHRRLWRDYLFGYFHVTAHWLAAFAPITNWLTGVLAFKNLAARVFQITPHRPFPKFTRRRAKVPTTEALSREDKIIFLPDPFSRYVEPQVEQAAFDILSAIGYEVLVLPVVGAGAGLIAKSFVESAQRHARSVLVALDRLDPERVLPVVGVEPSELYALKHDYTDLLPARADEIASRAACTWLLDEFLLRSERFNALRVASLEKLKLADQTERPKIKLQPHCHQRAEPPAADGLPIGAAATEMLLRAAGFDVEVAEAACCGMAGTFGYEAEHYELSMKVGKRILNSEFRNQNSTFACSGAACRMQVTQGTGREAVHPLVLVAEALLPKS